MKAFLVWMATAAAAFAAPNASILVSGDWLTAHLKDDSLVILHVGSPRDYAAGHIAGARLVTLADISITDPTGLRLELPPVKLLEEAFGKLGVSDASRVVIYAGNDSVQSATRVWFTLDYLGAGDRAALLDGGIAAWRADGRPLSIDAARVQPANFTAHPKPEVVVNAEWVRTHSGDPTVQLLDARLPEFYSGASTGGMPRAGHIPGARSVPYSSLLGENGKLQVAEKLAGPAALTVSYCHIGQQATVIYFAARYLGLNARLYDGSFQDWSRRADLPVEQATAVQALDAIFSPLTDAKSPGLAVLVRKDGQTLFERGYGVRDLRSAAKIDGQTNFRLASFTKQFTAMAVMLLVHDGKLTYDRRLTEIFPEFPAYGREITVRHLLNHTSGLPDYEATMGDGWSATRQIQDADVLQALERQASGKFAPGTSWEYSNSGFVVLGLIVQKVSGMPFRQFLRERIFAPLHMDTTVAFVAGQEEVANRAYGHNLRDGALAEADQSSTSATLGDGGVYSNLTDLAKWDEALSRHTLLSELEMAEALRPVPPKSYGFGWFLDPYKGRARMYHTGSSTGFRTVIERFTADRLTLIVLSNRTDLDPEKLALAAADALLR
ncbi:MAG TPA: serine hydrolase [Candidatus Sulfopaludibacter sp.]|jgi:CubicO group peptidase (beta-lactamase class C family)|nr:serine hydrolase [Candidatus Sulfopaludibacter sp.]